MKAEVSTTTHLSLPKSRRNARWWVVAASSAALITVLVAAALYLVTKKPSTVDNLVILTVPSGAEIKLDAKSYGNSPIKLEKVKVGTYTLTISKDGYETITEPVEVRESTPLEFKLKLLTPPEAANLTTEDQINFYEQKAKDAFAQGHYLFGDESAMRYADLMLQIDDSNQFARDLRESIRKRLLQAAQAKAASGNFGEAKEIYASLQDFYPKDVEIKAAAARLDSQLMTKRGEVRDYVRKAEDALRTGRLLEPARANAYFYATQALAIEGQNSQALAVYNEIKERLWSAAEQAQARGDIDAAIKQLEQAQTYFPQEKQFHTRLQEIALNRAAETAKVNDSKVRRRQGLDEHLAGDYANAVRDLEVALTNGESTPEVIFALGRSHFFLGHLDTAATYLRKVPVSAGDQYRSAIALLGEIALQRGDKNAALDKFKEARALGGSTLFIPATLDDKIERIEKQMREKAAEPVPVTIQAKHQHGALRGSCSGSLSVDSTGARYTSSEHNFSYNLVGISARLKKDELTLGFQGKSETFKASPADAERFREALTKYQSATQK